MPPRLPWRENNIDAIGRIFTLPLQFDATTHGTGLAVHAAVTTMALQTRAPARQYECGTVESK